MIDFIEFSINSVLAFVKIFDMKVNNVANSIVKQIEASCLINIIVRFGDIEEIKDGRQNLVHALDVLYLGV